MRTRICASVVVLLGSFPLAAQTGTTPGGATQGSGVASPYLPEFGPQAPWFAGTFLNHAYILLKLPSTWVKAELYAQTHFNAHLAVINFPQEHNFLYQTFTGTLSDSRDLWIGMTDKFNEGTWQWITGEPVTYTAWGPSEPNNYSGFNPGGEDFAQFMGPASYVPTTWNDMSPFDTIYTQPIHGVIEYIPSAASVPNPISLATGGMHVLPIAAPPHLAGQEYFVLGSISGTQPGFDVGGVHVPLVLDAYTLYTFSHPADGFLRAAHGRLDANAEALAAFQVPAGLSPGLVGLQVHHCAVVHDHGSVQAVTVPLAATLVP
jgi:hypothetical protein